MQMSRCTVWFVIFCMDRRKERAPHFTFRRTSPAAGHCICRWCTRGLRALLVVVTTRCVSRLASISLQSATRLTRHTQTDSNAPRLATRVSVIGVAIFERKLPYGRGRIEERFVQDPEG